MNKTIVKHSKLLFPAMQILILSQNFEPFLYVCVLSLFFFFLGGGGGCCVDSQSIHDFTSTQVPCSVEISQLKIIYFSIYCRYGRMLMVF